MIKDLKKLNIIGITIHEDKEKTYVVYTEEGDELLYSKKYIKMKLGSIKFKKLLKN